MGVLAQLVGLDAEPEPAPPKFADAQAFLDAVKERFPKGTRIYEHFKIAMAAYGAGPKTEAAKELLVREVSCCFITSPDLAMAFDEFYGAALGMSAVRRPPRIERATSRSSESEPGATKWARGRTRRARPRGGSSTRRRRRSAPAGSSRRRRPSAI